MTKRSEQKEKRREDILRAGLRLFVRKGYAKIAEIAQEADMSIGLLYSYFASTEALYEALVDIALAGRSGRYFPENEADSPLDYFRSAARHIFEMAKEDSSVAEYFVLISHAQRDPSLPQGLRDRLKQNDVIDRSVGLIEEGQKNGSIRAGNATALALAFWLSVQGYMEMIALNPDAPFPDTEWFVDIIKKQQF